jgi:hypothetical protein
MAMAQRIRGGKRAERQESGGLRKLSTSEQYSSQFSGF